MDLEYVNDISFFKDVAIVFKTFFKVIKRSDVVREGTVSDIDYGDWLLSKSEITQEEYDEKLKTFGLDGYILLENMIAKIIAV